MALVFGNGLVVFEDLGFEKRPVSFAGLLERLWTFGVVLESGLVELQSFLDLDFLGVVDFVLDLVVRFEIERMPGRLLCC